MNGLLINMAATYSPSKVQVPSAMGGLTSLFGMGRGEHPRQNHHKSFRCSTLAGLTPNAFLRYAFGVSAFGINKVILGSLSIKKEKNKAYG